MTALSNYAESAIGDALLRGVTFTAPSTVYTALFTTNPGEDNSGTEVSDSGYARQQAHDSVVGDGFTESPVGTFTNANIIEFPVVDDAQITVTHVGIFDASSNGNQLLYAALGSSKVFEVGDVPRFAAGSLVFVLS